MKHVPTFLLVLAFIAAAGCSEGADTEEGASTPSTSHPAAAAKGGTFGITLDLPEGWTPYPKEDHTDFYAGAGKHFTLWVLPPDTTEDEAVAEVASIIEPKVEDFEVASEDVATVAGVPAHHLAGPGVEADDGDDSRAEVYVFTLGDRVRVACVHGEGKAAEILRPEALAILSTAKPK